MGKTPVARKAGKQSIAQADTGTTETAAGGPSVGRPTRAATRAAMEAFGPQDWRRLLASFGENPDRQGLLETPERVARAWSHWSRGYREDPAAILKTFADGGERYNELIVVRQIPVYSHCEHHLAPFFGHAAIGYLPSGRIVGLSKLKRLVDCFAARLQVQERLTQQIAQSLVEHLMPKAVGIILRCRHLCMESRGIAVPGEETVTSAMLGDLEHNNALRGEFLALTRQE